MYRKIAGRLNVRPRGNPYAHIQYGEYKFRKFRSGLLFVYLETWMHASSWALSTVSKLRA